MSLDGTTIERVNVQSLSTSRPNCRMHSKGEITLRATCPHNLGYKVAISRVPGRDVRASACTPALSSTRSKGEERGLVSVTTDAQDERWSVRAISEGQVFQTELRNDMCRREVVSAVSSGQATRLSA